MLHRQIIDGFGRTQAVSPEANTLIASLLGEAHPGLPVVLAGVERFVGGADPLGLVTDHGTADRIVPLL